MAAAALLIGAYRRHFLYGCSTSRSRSLIPAGVRALRDHDEVLGEAIDSLRYDLGRKGSTGHLPGKIHFIAPARIGKKFVDALDVRVIELVADRFQWGLKVAQAYAAKHGSLESQRAHDVFMNFPLGHPTPRSKERHALR